MSVKIRAKILICALLFFFASLCLVAIYTTAAEDMFLEMRGAIKEYYAFGSEFSVPNAEFVSEENRYKAYTVVYDPDREVITDKTFMLNKKGEYRISYSATIGSKQHMEIYAFNSADLSEDAFTVVNNAKITAEATTPDYYCLQSGGVKLTATADGGNVNYSKVIDLRGNTKKDVLLSLGIIPREEGVEDLWQVTVTLTDIHDSTNKIRIVTYRGSWGNAYCFTRAAAKGQALAGYDYAKKVVQTEYRMGTGSTHSFTGVNAAGYGALNYAYDDKEKAVYVGGSQVIDFDNPDHFIESLLWEGFTTGEVILNVSLEKLKATEADIMIFNVNGNDLTGKVIEDTQAPIIDIDFGAYENGALPYGETGKTYPLFPAKAYDRCQGAIKQTDIVTTIYKNYNTSAQELTAEKVSRFTPTSAGEYYVQYACTDVSGNTRYNGYTVTVKNTLPEMSLIGYEMQNSYYVGTEIVFPAVNVSGGSGTPSAEMSLRKKDGNVISRNIEKWTAYEAGEYEAEISATDYLGSEFRRVFIFETVVKNEPIIKVGYVPQYLTAGIAYTFEPFEAIDYSSSSAAQEADKKIIISYAGAETEIAADESYTPAWKNGYDVMSVTFYAESVDGSYSDCVEKEIRLVEAVNNGMVDYARLFVGDCAEFTVNKSDMRIDFERDTEISYVNPLIANDFVLSFDVDKSRNNFEKVIIKLTDSVDPAISVALSVEKGSETAMTSNLRINGSERVYAIEGSFFDTTKRMFDLSYSKTMHYLIDEAGARVICALKETESGEKFTGFSSGKIYVSLRFESVRGSSAVILHTISNQAFNDAGEDLSAPVLDVAETVASQVEINGKVTVPKAYAADGVDPAAKVTVSVYRGKKILHSNVDASDKGFEFVADTYQTYKIVYVTTDWQNNVFERTYSVYVQDVEAPVLTVNWDLTRAKKGETHTLPIGTATDNNDERLAIEIFVYYPQGDCRAYKDALITFQEKGTYTFVFFVWDKAGNYAKKFFEVTVI